MFISFGYLTKKSLLFIAVPIAMFVRILLVYNVTKKNNLFYHSFLKYLGRSINGILWFAVERRITSNKIEEQDTVLATPDQNVPQQNDPDILNKEKFKRKRCAFSEYRLDYYSKNKIKQISNCTKTFLLILVCILDFVSVICNRIVVKKKFYSEYSSGLVSLITIRLFLMAILSQLILKNTKIYSHHFLSIIVILITVITINIFSIIETENIKVYFSQLGLMILPELFLSIMYVCGAKYLSITKGNIYKLLFYDGIIGMILMTLLQAVTYFISCGLIKNYFDTNTNCDNYERNLNGMIESFGFGKLLNAISLLLVLVSFCEIWFIWLLIFNFSVNHFGAIYSIPLFFTYFTFK